MKDLISRQAVLKLLSTMPPEETTTKALLIQSVKQMDAPDNLVKASQGIAKDLVNDCISRQAAIDATWFEPSYTDPLNVLTEVRDRLKALPSAQPQPAIPLEWIAKHLEWLDNCDNDFAQLAKVSIKVMVELWKKDRI